MLRSKHDLRKKNQPARRSRRVKAVTLALTLCLTGASALVMRGVLPLGKNSSLRGQPSYPQTGTSQLRLSKEYIYAGGRLIATEEPSDNSALAPPSGFSSHAFSSTQITLRWSPSTGATGYRIERRKNGFTEFESLGEVGEQSLEYIDTVSVAEPSAYLYRVKAVGTGGIVSLPSNTDLASAIAFTDEALTPKGTDVKGQHLIELRAIVDRVRQLAGLSAAVYTNANPLPPPSSRIIYLKDIDELRDRLDEALAALGVTRTAYTRPQLTTSSQISVVDLQDIRDVVRGKR